MMADIVGREDGAEGSQAARQSSSEKHRTAVSSAFVQIFVIDKQDA